MHRNLLGNIMIDLPSDVHDQGMAFWSAALGATPAPTRMLVYHILENAVPPNAMAVQLLGGGSARVHFDIFTDDLDSEVERRTALGATVVDPSQAHQPGRWVVMRDPAGMDFCVVWGLNEILPQALRDDF